MTRHYQEWYNGPDGAVTQDVVPWQKLVPPGWEGFCCYCHRRLRIADWQAGEIAAAGAGAPWYCLCMSHLQVKGPEYYAAIDALAKAVVGF